MNTRVYNKYDFGKFFVIEFSLVTFFIISVILFSHFYDSDRPFKAQKPAAYVNIFVSLLLLATLISTCCKERKVQHRIMQYEQDASYHENQLFFPRSRHARVTQLNIQDGGEERIPLMAAGMAVIQYHAVDDEIQPAIPPSQSTRV